MQFNHVFDRQARQLHTNEPMEESREGFNRTLSKVGGLLHLVSQTNWVVQNMKDREAARDGEWRMEGVQESFPNQPRQKDSQEKKGHCECAQELINI